MIDIYFPCFKTYHIIQLHNYNFEIMLVFYKCDLSNLNNLL